MHISGCLQAGVDNTEALEIASERIFFSTLNFNQAVCLATPATRLMTTMAEVLAVAAPVVALKEMVWDEAATVAERPTRTTTEAQAADDRAMMTVEEEAWGMAEGVLPTATNLAGVDTTTTMAVGSHHL